VHSCLVPGFVSVIGRVAGEQRALNLATTFRYVSPISIGFARVPMACASKDDAAVPELGFAIGVIDSRRGAPQETVLSADGRVSK